MENNKILIRIVFVILLIFISFCCVPKGMQNDTFYMIKLGDYIVHHGIDLKDHWSWIAGLTYTYPHWLYDIFIYYVYKLGGYDGIYISTVICHILLMFVFYIINVKSNKNEILTMIFTLFICVIVSPSATARASSISNIIFLLEIYYIFRLIDSGKKRYIIILSLLSLVLANIHGTSWIFYFILFLPFIGEEIVYCFKKKFKFKSGTKLIIDKINNFKYLMIAFASSLAMGIFTPSRICYSYVFRIMMGNSQKFIAEHAHLIVIEIPPFIILCFMFIAILSFSKAKIKLSELFMITGLFIMSLEAFRHTILFYLIGGTFIVLVAIRYFSEKKNKTYEKIVNKLNTNWYIWVAIAVIVGLVNQSNKDEGYINKKIYPVDTVNYIKENLDYKNINLFNTYNNGSYIMFNDIPVLIDSRCDLYLNEFNKGIEVFNDVLDIKVSTYKKVFKKYKIEYILMDNDSIFYELLIRDTGEKIYSDEFFSIFKLNPEE